MPLVTERNTLGVLMLENRQQPNSFVPGDLPFLQAVADIIALEIAHAGDLPTLKQLLESNSS